MSLPLRAAAVAALTHTKSLHKCHKIFHVDIVENTSQDLFKRSDTHSSQYREIAASSLRWSVVVWTGPAPATPGVAASDGPVGTFQSRGAG
jgi:hypothetical protein